MRAGSKLVLTIIAALLLHGIFYYYLADPAAQGRSVFDPLLSSLLLNLAGVPIGIYLGKTEANRTGVTTPRFGRFFVTVLFGWVIVFGFLAAPGLLIGKYITDAIRESGEIPDGRPRFRPTTSLAPVFSFRTNR